jgi:hypothetical protein
MSWTAKHTALVLTEAGALAKVILGLFKEQLRHAASEGIHMKHRVVELGVASRRTLDYSGNHAFDNLTFSFKRFHISW